MCQWSICYLMASVTAAQFVMCCLQSSILLRISCSECSIGPYSSKHFDIKFASDMEGVSSYCSRRLLHIHTPVIPQYTHHGFYVSFFQNEEYYVLVNITSHILSLRYHIISIKWRVGSLIGLARYFCNLKYSRNRRYPWLTIFQCMY